MTLLVENNSVIYFQSLDSDDIDYAQAEKYYKQYFQVHRPGPVYTIPEGEEEDGIINTEGKYHGNPDFLTRASRAL